MKMFWSRKLSCLWTALYYLLDILYIVINYGCTMLYCYSYFFDEIACGITKICHRLCFEVQFCRVMLYFGHLQSILSKQKCERSQIAVKHKHIK